MVFYLSPLTTALYRVRALIIQSPDIEYGKLQFCQIYLIKDLDKRANCHSKTIFVLPLCPYVVYVVILLVAFTGGHFDGKLK